MPRRGSAVVPYVPSALPFCYPALTSVIPTKCQTPYTSDLSKLIRVVTSNTDYTILDPNIPAIIMLFFLKIVVYLSNIGKGISLGLILLAVWSPGFSLCALKVPVTFLRVPVTILKKSKRSRENCPWHFCPWHFQSTRDNFRKSACDIEKVAVTKMKKKCHKTLYFAP